jgi:DNA-binding MarR family transcriptional regulator
MAKPITYPGGHTKSGAAFTELVIETFRLNGRLLASGDRLTKGVGLTSARWQVLGTLRKQPVPIPVAHIARNMGLQRQSVQRTVDLLAREGLVKLVDNPNHRRARLVVLTPRGRAAIRKASRLQIEWANESARGIDGEDLHKAFLILRKLRQRLGDRAGPWD